MFEICLLQKPENKFQYFPAKSQHETHTISNYASSELNYRLEQIQKKSIFQMLKVFFLAFTEQRVYEMEVKASI